MNHKREAHDELLIADKFLLTKNRYVRYKMEDDDSDMESTEKAERKQMYRDEFEHEREKQAIPRFNVEGAPVVAARGSDKERETQGIIC